MGKTFRKFTSLCMELCWAAMSAGATGPQTVLLPGFVLLLQCMCVLRRLRFLAGPGERSKADDAAHAALAALALAACLGQDLTGYALRSRCDLVPEAGQPSGFDLIQSDGAVQN